MKKPNEWSWGLWFALNAFGYAVLIIVAILIVRMLK
jgi:hypothetical protein